MAGVPYAALPPPDRSCPAPLVLSWHLMDPPATDVAMAAALPLAELPTWRVYLGLPLTGRRLPAGGFEELMRLGAEDAVGNIWEPILAGAVAEAPAALAALRAELDIADGPVGLLGGSAGGCVVPALLAEQVLPAAAAVVIKPAIRLTSVITVNESLMNIRYHWTPEGRAFADRFDFLRRTGDITTGGVPLLTISGTADHTEFRTDVTALQAALGEQASVLEIVGMAHPIAEATGLNAVPRRRTPPRSMRWPGPSLPSTCFPNLLRGSRFAHTL